MQAIRLPNGNLLIPVEPDDSDANDCMAEITSDDPEYGTWLTCSLMEKIHARRQKSEMPHSIPG
jgi:hypothetical protein